MNNPEEIFTKLILLKDYFKPYKWDLEFIPNKKVPLLNNIQENCTFISNFKLYEVISKLYPTTSDINSMILGLYAKRRTIYDLRVNDISEYIFYWSSLTRTWKLKVKEDLKIILYTIETEGVQPRDLFKIPKSGIPLIYREFYIKEYISGLTMASLYNKYPKIMSSIKDSIDLTSRDLEISQFNQDLYFWYKLQKLLT